MSNPLANVDPDRAALLGPIGRRSLLKAIGLGAVGVTFLAACGDEDDTGSSQTLTSSTEGKIPTTTFVDVVPAVPQTFDTAAGISAANVAIVPNWCSTLVARGAKPTDTTQVATSADVQPYLAKSWTVDDKGNYTMILRDDVVSAAGNKLTTADVDYTFKRILAIDTVAQATLSHGNVDLKNPITVIDDKTFTLNVTAPSPITLGCLPWFACGILDSALMKKNATAADEWSKDFFSKNSATFGAYSVAAFEPGVSVTLKANPNHFASVYFKDVVVKAVTDASSRLQLVLTGQASHTVGLTWTQFSTAAAQGASKYIKAEAMVTSSMQMLILNQKYAPLANKKVRQAIAYGINKQAIADSIYLGKAQAAKYQVPNSIPLPFTPTTREYDVAKAKALLAEAGYANGFDLELATTPGAVGSWAADELALIQAQLKEIGINATVRVIQSTTEFYALSGKLQTSLNQVNPDPADAGNYLDNQWTLHNPFSVGSKYSYNNPELQPLLDQIKTSTGTARDELVQKAYTIVEEDVPAVPVIVPVTQNITDQSITGYAVYSYAITFYEYLKRA